MTPQVVITGLGFITSIGNDKVSVVNSLKDLRHGFERVTFFDNPDLPVKVAGTIKDFDTESPNWWDWKYPEHYEVDKSILRSVSPHGLYSICAMLQAISDTGLPLDTISNSETGLFCASGASGLLMNRQLAELNDSQGRRGNPMGVVNSYAGTLNFNLSTYFKIRGINCGFVSACTSASHALGYAWDEIRLGRQKRIFVVGAEECSQYTVLPFNSMRALSRNSDPNLASRPFDKDRDGFVCSGGAVVLLLENLDTARERNAKIYAEMLGWAQASDGYNISQSHPEGEGMQRALNLAFDQTGISPQQVDYVNAHATSTPAGDRSEALALQSVFTKNDAHPYVSSTKALTGHSLSMSGALEASICALSISEKIIPGAAHLNNPDPVCQGLNFPEKTLNHAPSIVVNNGSGFGGTNVCHIFTKKNS